MTSGVFQMRWKGVTCGTWGGGGKPLYYIIVALAPFLPFVSFWFPQSIQLHSTTTSTATTEYC